MSVPLRSMCGLAILAVVLAAQSASGNISVNCAPSGSVTLSNPNPPFLGSSVTAIPSHGVIEQSVNGGAFVIKGVGDPISWAANSIVNYRNTSAAASDSFSIGGFVFDVTIVAGPPPTPTTTTTQDVTITWNAADQAINVSAQVSPIPPSGTVTFSIPGAGSNAVASVNAQGSATTNFVVTGGTPSGNYTITATFHGPANYASSFGTATLHINFFITDTTPAHDTTIYNPAAHGMTLHAAVTSQFGGTVAVGKVTFTVYDGVNVLGVPVQSGTVAANAASASFTVPAGTPAGDYSVTADYSGGGNFLPSTGYGTMTVNKADQVIGFGPLADVQYGVAPFAISATPGATGNPVTFSVVSGPGMLQGNMLTVTGGGMITLQADEAGDANYNAGVAQTTQNVTPAPLTVTADPQTRLYGAANPTLTFSAAPFLNGDTAATTLTGALATASPSSPVGSYPITQGTLASTNYAITFVGSTLTVTKATLSVVADPQFRIVGAPNPALTYSFSGFVNNDDASAVGGAAQLQTFADDASPPGDYSIMFSGTSLSAANYMFDLVNGVLHVANPPGSQVDGVDAASCDATDLTVHWSRTDGETDPVTYSVYVSENGGPYLPIVTDTTDTSAPFAGTLGSTYGFYSVEKDQVGNLEQPPVTPDIQYVIAACDGNDFAVTKIKAPKTVALTQNVPAKVVRVKVEIQNRSPHPETVSDLLTLAKLVHFDVGSNGLGCVPPVALIHAGKPQHKLPLTLKPKAKVQVLFDLPIACANDATKGAGHEDYRLSAQVFHSALGSGDAHPADNGCPRTVSPPGEIDPFPNGKILDKGCGAKKPDKTLGLPLLLDVLVKP
ncbi:MAG: Ig-like domain repeat protein [Deltaproteobacteria bacterium]|nr:MAG: Ig-like domain repeat protein [Deltaproteobacteria bacterium]